MSNNVYLGQGHSNNFAPNKIQQDGIPGPETDKQKVFVLQRGINADYGLGIPEDGMLGQLTVNGISGHYVDYGETQYMVTVLEILLYLNDIDAGGVECPGTYGDGLASAVAQYKAANGLGGGTCVDENMFIALAGGQQYFDNGSSDTPPDCGGYNPNNLPNFGPDEFKCACGCGGDIKNELKCRIQSMRDELSAYKGEDSPLVITSGFRCPPENARQGGVPDSLHQYGEACDLYTPGMSEGMVDTLKQIAHNNDLHVGTYYSSQFVHVQLGGSDFSGD